MGMSPKLSAHRDRPMLRQVQSPIEIGVPRETCPGLAVGAAGSTDPLVVRVGSVPVWLPSLHDPRAHPELAFSGGRAVPGARPARRHLPQGHGLPWSSPPVPVPLGLSALSLSHSPPLLAGAQSHLRVGTPCSGCLTHFTDKQSGLGLRHWPLSALVSLLCPQRGSGPWRGQQWPPGVTDLLALNYTRG